MYKLYDKRTGLYYSKFRWTKQGRGFGRLAYLESAFWAFWRQYGARERHKGVIPDYWTIYQWTDDGKRYVSTLNEFLATRRQGNE